MSSGSGRTTRRRSSRVTRASAMSRVVPSSTSGASWSLQGTASYSTSWPRISFTPTATPTSDMWMWRQGSFGDRLFYVTLHRASRP